MLHSTSYKAYPISLHVTSSLPLTQSLPPTHQHTLPNLMDSSFSSHIFLSLLLLSASHIFLSLLLLSAAVDNARAVGIVIGSVFCDRCKDGKMTPFDYPLSGAKVELACPGSDGKMTVWKEGKTNWLGSYAVRFDGAPDLSSCTARVVPASGQGDCLAAAGPARGLNLMFRLFNMEMFTVDALLSQPAQPMSYCQKPSGSRPPPSPSVAPPSPPLVAYPPPLRPPSPPSVRVPPVPFFQASACPSQ